MFVVNSYKSQCYFMFEYYVVCTVAGGVTCYTCVNVSDNSMCNEFAIDRPCPKGKSCTNTRNFNGMIIELEWNYKDKHRMRDL